MCSSSTQQIVVGVSIIIAVDNIDFGWFLAIVIIILRSLEFLFQNIKGNTRSRWLNGSRFRTTLRRNQPNHVITITIILRLFNMIRVLLLIFLPVVIIP